MPIEVTTPNDLIPMLTRLDDVRARVDVLDAESAETATAIQAHEARITLQRNDLIALTARVAALEPPVGVPPPPAPPVTRLVGPSYYLPRTRFAFAKANGIDVAHDWVPQAIGKFDDLAALGMRCDIELAANAAAAGGADTVAEVRAWLQQALIHPKAMQVVRRIILADEAEQAPAYMTADFLRPLYAECKRVAPQWPVVVLVTATDHFWNPGRTQPYLADDVCDVVAIDHYLYKYPGFNEIIERNVRRVRDTIGPTRAINFVNQAFDPSWDSTLILPTPIDLRDMGLAALRGGATDVGLYTEGQYTNALWPNIGVATAAWRA